MDSRRRFAKGNSREERGGDDEFHFPMLRRAGRRRIGKMRHSAVPEEMAGEVLAFDERRGSLAGEIAKVADEVRLIVVAAGERGLDPAAAGFDLLEHALETLDPAEELRREADGFFEAPLDLADADAEPARDPADIDGAAAGFDQANRFAGQAVYLAVSGETIERFRGAEGGGKVLQRDFAAGELVHGKAEESRGSFRTEADSHDPGGTGGTDLHGTGELADQKTLRLFVPCAVAERFERPAEIEDQLGAAIGDDSLDGAGIHLEEPEAIDNLSRRASGTDFTIVHPGKRISGPRDFVLFDLLVQRGAVDAEDRRRLP